MRTKNLFKDILSAITGMFGGETTHYSHLLNESSVRESGQCPAC